jgi:hypothetical protein
MDTQSTLTDALVLLYPTQQAESHGQEMLRVLPGKTEAFPKTPCDEDLSLLPDLSLKGNFFFLNRLLGAT